MVWELELTRPSQVLRRRRRRHREVLFLLPRAVQVMLCTSCSSRLLPTLSSTEPPLWIPRYVLHVPTSDVEVIELEKGSLLTPSSPLRRHVEGVASGLSNQPLRTLQAVHEGAKGTSKRSQQLVLIGSFSVCCCRAKRSSQGSPSCSSSCAFSSFDTHPDSLDLPLPPTGIDHSCPKCRRRTATCLSLLTAANSTAWRRPSFPATKEAARGLFVSQ